LEQLYQLVARLDAEKDKYSRPITVMDRKTHYAMEGNKHFLDFRKEIVERNSDVLDAWCVDTCQMWYSGLGMAFEKGGPEDVYWLIPGDFNYVHAIARSPGPVARPSGDHPGTATGPVHRRDRDRP
jgi:hypothetical protein